MNLHRLQLSDYDIKYQNSDYPGEVGRFPHPTAISGGNKHMCVFYQTCVEKSQHLSVGFSDTYLVISTHVCNKTHQCGKSHIAALCVEVGFTKQVWKKPNMCGNTHIY